MLLVWMAAGALTWFGASICAELSSAYPQTGGVYVFLRQMFSPAIGFLWGWAMFWSMHSGIVAAIAVVAGRYAAVFVNVDERATAVGAIAAFSFINYLGVRQGSAVQTFFTIVKVAGILVLLILCVSAPALGRAALPRAAAPTHFRDFTFALVAGLFAYGGWHMVTYAAGETREAERTIPRALMIGVFVVTACYLALNAAYVHVLPIEKVIASK